MPRSAVSKQLKHNITQDCAWRTMTDQKRLLLGSYGGPAVQAWREFFTSNFSITPSTVRLGDRGEIPRLARRRHPKDQRGPGCRRGEQMALAAVDSFELASSLIGLRATCIGRFNDVR